MLNLIQSLGRNPAFYSNLQTSSVLLEPLSSYCRYRELLTPGIPFLEPRPGKSYLEPPSFQLSYVVCIRASLLFLVVWVVGAGHTHLDWNGWGLKISENPTDGLLAVWKFISQHLADPYWEGKEWSLWLLRFTLQLCGYRNIYSVESQLSDLHCGEMLGAAAQGYTMIKCINPCMGLLTVPGIL